MHFSNRQIQLLRMLAHVDQQIADVKSKLNRPAFDYDDAEMMVELLAGLQGTRRYVERSLQFRRVDR